MSIFLHALSLKNYRGIGSNRQFIGPFKSCNFFVGTNNSGKSCILNFISEHLSQAQFKKNSPLSMPLSALEIHLGATINQVEFGFGVPKLIIFEEIKSILNNNQDTLSECIKSLHTLISHLSHLEFIWIVANPSDITKPKLLKSSIKEIRLILNDREWYNLWHNMSGRNGGSVIDYWIPEIVNHILKLLILQYPESKIIPAKRQIGSKGVNFSDFSGAGLIDKLAELQNPSPTERIFRLKFDKINEFLQDVVGDSSAMIEIPHDRKEVMVDKSDRILPLSSLGTGIHEVVMIAAFCTLTEKSIVCIEEPEIHLHPLLQKKLIKYITKKTDNQYFIATHSASIIDQVGAAVFHVTQQENSTSIELATKASQRFQVCQDLGYRASDLLQTNAIIWVEGPSDRIYVKHWLRALDSEIYEGIHYSIMFYGGRLLSHLSANDDDISEFISLKSLNRNMAIIIDSDRKTSRSRINKTKKRVINEFLSNSEPAWLTAGREIENYIPPNLLEKALKDVYNLFDRVESEEKYAHRLHFFSKGSASKLHENLDKVRIARAVCKYPADLTTYDLQKRTEEILTMIRKANEQ